jgi:hypothetical protein
MIIDSFQQFLSEKQNSEYNANLSLSSTHHGSSMSVRHNSPFAAVNNKEEARKKELHNAALGHVRRGDHKQAFNAAYAIAHKHATEDKHDKTASHEIATRKANYTVKKAQEFLKK